MSLVLGIETSCDDSSVAVIDDSDGFRILSHASYAQIEQHSPFGGVVPEEASRSHYEMVYPVYREALKLAGVKLLDIDAISVTQRPGLMGSLLMGITLAKSLRLMIDRPLIPVHHMEGHIASLFLQKSQLEISNIRFPLLVLIASGGHTQFHLLIDRPDQWRQTMLQDTVMGSTRDDALGEAFDKIAKKMGLPFPGGKYLEAQAKGGDVAKWKYPSPRIQGAPYDLSYSGLKTAAMMEIERNDPDVVKSADFAASIQHALFNPVLIRLKKAIVEFNAQSIAIVGGVSANLEFQRVIRLLAESSPMGPDVLVPPSGYSTDNGAMIAAAGSIRWRQGLFPKGDLWLEIDAQAAG